MGNPIAATVGAKIIGGGYSYGEYDVSVTVEAPDPERDDIGGSLARTAASCTVEADQRMGRARAGR